MLISNKQAKMLGIKQTLDLKSIMLESEGYIKVKNPIRTRFFALFGFVSFIYCVGFYIVSLFL